MCRRCWLHPAQTRPRPASRRRGLHGFDRRRIEEFARSADLVWNFAAALREPLLSLFRHRVLVDLDPGHLQVSALSWDLGLERHDAFLTVGTNLHGAACEVPTLGVVWQPFLPFVHLPMWSVTPDPGPSAPLTSVTQWTWEEVRLGPRVISVSKRDAYLAYVTLPRRAGRPFELAVNLDPADQSGDRQRLLEAGWRIVDPHVVAGSPRAYQRYLAASRAGVRLSQADPPGAADRLVQRPQCELPGQRAAGLVRGHRHRGTLAGARRAPALPRRRGGGDRRGRDRRRLGTPQQGRARPGRRSLRRATVPAGHAGGLCDTHEPHVPRILLTGTLAGRPNTGGNTWAFLQWVLGFQRLGFETFFVEEIAAKDIVDEAGTPVPLEASVNAQYFRHVEAAYGLEGRLAVLEHDGPGQLGLSRTEVTQVARDAVLFLNQYGALTSILPVVTGRSVYWDTDPGYTQVWQEAYGVDMRLRDHDLYLTVGLNLGQPDCPLPTAGVPWVSTLWPVVLDQWSTSRPAGDTYTTVADWRGFGSVEWGGVGTARRPTSSGGSSSSPDGSACRSSSAWPCIRMTQSARTSCGTGGMSSLRRAVATPEAYRDYVIGSRGELTCVKSICTAGRLAWIGDRTAAYLAAGRPVVIQSTGIEPYLPTGDGLLTFTDLDGAVAALECVEADYAHHAQAARALAREHLDSDRVLERLLGVLRV